jgi:hypothetical protein
MIKTNASLSRAEFCLVLTRLLSLEGRTECDVVQQNVCSDYCVLNLVHCIESGTPAKYPNLLVKFRLRSYSEGGFCKQFLVGTCQVRQDRQCTYSVTFRRVRVTIVAAEKP